MATTFDLDTYPLEDKTSFQDDGMVDFTKMRDGTIRTRTVSTTTYRDFDCVFCPMFSTQAEALTAYLLANLTTEFDITYKALTYRGYFYSKPKVVTSQGDLSRVRVKFHGALI